MKNERRKTIRIISFLAAIIIALAVWGTINTVALHKMKLKEEAARERALTSLGTSLDTISVNLDKSVYASTSPMIAEISGNVWRASTAAKTNLAEITDGSTEISAVYKFLSQVGEYSMALSEKAASGEKISTEESEMLYKLKEYAGKLSSEINYLIDEKQSGGLSFEELKTTLADENTEKLYYGTEIEDTNQIMDDYPTLIYDGPFSDHINTGKSEIVENLEAVTKEVAQKKVADFLKVDAETLVFLSECDSNLSCYTFYNADYTVSVTKKGGIVSYFLSTNSAGESFYKAENAIKNATEFLKSNGYKNIKESYYFTSDGVCTVNFSYYENGITYYTDLIKVGVALDTGDIVSFDSTGYLMNHKSRAVPENIKLTPEKAQNVLSENLTVKSWKKCFIPTDFETETYTYEYHCVSKDKTEVLVYIDPQTGNEAELLILLYSDGGILTE